MSRVIALWLEAKIDFVTKCMCDNDINGIKQLIN